MKRFAQIWALAAVTLLGRTAVAQQSATSAPAIDFSGVAFGSYNMRTDSAAKAALGGKAPNQFSLDRVYLTFKMPAGDNALIRITTDVFQNTTPATNGFYQGWAIRLKYAYFQYTGMKDALGAGSSLTGRVGSLHNVVIDHQEVFWPRYFQQVGTERNGFFSSADVGVAGLLTLGKKMGEVYATVTNGSGYTSYEKDRFKDVALRLSLTPFANSSTMNTFAKSLTISPWFYKGALGSAFAAGGTLQTGPGDNGAITEGLDRKRFGVFAGVKDRRLTAGAEFAQRMDQSESGANTLATPRVVTDSTGRLIDGFVIVRPMEWIDASKKSGVSVLARFDHFTPNTSPTSVNYAGTTPAYNFMILGASYELNQRITLALDWQAQNPSSFPPVTLTSVKPTPKQSTLFVHWQATF